MAEFASDAILLERFARGHEEDAFAVLVRRHGPLVERTARRLLRDERDVEDVFQAAFLVLARKAPGIAWQGSVGNWLVAVTRRLALNARSAAAKRRKREITVTGLCGGAIGGDGRLPEPYHPSSDEQDGPADLERRELHRALDDELLRLPEKYRAPVLLCDLEGRTHEEAARRLGWPTGSMSRRLDRGRSLLRQRLAHRGLAVVLLGALCAALGALGAAAMLDRAGRKTAVHQAMVPFRPVSRGGQGLNAVLAAMSRADGPRPDTREVLRLVRQALGSAQILSERAPRDHRGPWLEHARAMERSARRLALAAQDADQLAMTTAARQLNASCVNCHRAYQISDVLAPENAAPAAPARPSFVF